MLEKSDDTTQRFLFEEHNIRGEIVRLHQSYLQCTENRDYPLSVQKLVGEALAASVLLTTSLKFEGSLTLQVQGAGPLHLLLSQCTHELQVRGLAKWNQAPDPTLPFSFSHGTLAITLKPKEGTQYQGTVELSGYNLAEALEVYFEQSEQLPTYLFLTSDAEYVAGFFLQKIPGNNQDPLNEYWDHFVHLARTLKSEELLELDAPTLLRRLFSEEDIYLFDPKKVSFQCRCNLDRMSSAIFSLGQEEALSLLSTNKTIVVTCEFCLHHHTFDRIDVEQIFKGHAPTEDSGSTH